MILSNVNIGTGPSAGDGDPLRSAFTTINNNFQTIENNVNALTNSVNSVAGRTGNVVLTVNDIIGLSNAYAIASSTATANTAMRGYVDAKIAANIAALINGAPGALDTLQELAAALGNNASFSATIINSLATTNSNLIVSNTTTRAYVDGQIIAANSGISSAVTLANTGMKGYVDYNSLVQSTEIANANVAMKGYVDQANSIQSAQVNAANLAITAANVGIIGYIDQANTIQSAQVNAANLAITAANVGLKGYVDFTNSVQSTEIATANIGLKGYVDQANSIQSAQIAAANIGLKGYVDQANTIQSAQLTSANLGILGYIDLANTIQSAQVGAANLAIVAANLGMKGYVDSVATLSIYSNVNAKAYTESMGFSNYSNSNVRSYFTGGFDGNILPSANVTYSLGSPTRQWKDLYVSNNTIFIGGTPLSSTPGGLTFAGVPVSSFAPTAATTVTPGTVWNFANTGRASGQLMFPAYGSGKFVIVENESYGGSPLPNIGMYSTDGATWTTMRMPNVATQATTIAYGAGKFVVPYAGGAAGSGPVAYSEDGINWTLKSNAIPYVEYTGSPGSNNCTWTKTGAAYGNGRFVLLSSIGARTVISTDGITWSNGSAYGSTLYGSSNPLPLADGQGYSLYWQSLTFDNGWFLASAYRQSGTGANVFAYSSDGINWTRTQLSTGAAPGYTGSYLLGSGGGAFIAIPASGTIGLRSTDNGRTWSNINIPSAYSYTSVTYGGGAFILTPSGVAGSYPGSGAGNANVALSTDGGITWSSVPTPYNAYYGGGAYGAGTFIAAGNWYGNVLNVSYSNSVGALTLAPTLPGTIDRVDIGVSTPGSGAFTSLSADSISTSGDISTLGNISITGDISAGNVLLPDNTAIYNVDANTAVFTSNVISDATSLYLTDTGNAIVYASDYIVLETNSDGNVSQQWTFNQNGNIRFPDATTQSTAFSNTAPIITTLNNNTTQANIGLKGYVDQANSIQSAQISAANVGMKGYVDSQSFYSNTKVATYLQAGNISNVSLAGNVTATYFLGNGAFLTGISGGVSSYGNVQVATYLPTYSGNVANVRLDTSGVLTFADGTTQITAASGGGSSYGNANVTAYTVSMGFKNYGNVNVSALITTNGLTNYSNVNVIAYLAGNITTANIYAGGINTGTIKLTNAVIKDTAGAAVSFGQSAGQLSQGASAVAIGLGAGYDAQGNAAVAIGYGAGDTLQGLAAVAIGAFAGPANQGDNSIIINATGSALGQTTANTFTVAPIRTDSGNTAQALYYNTTTKEVTYANVTAGGYSNVQVATYLPTYTGNVANVRLGTSGVLTFADGTTQTTAASGGGSNYGNANVTAYTVSMGFTNFSNVNVAALITTNGLTNYSNVNVKAYSETMGYQNFGNVNVASYLGTGQITAANVKLAPSGNIQFADGTTQSSAYSNVNLTANLRGSITVGNITILGALNTTLNIGNSFIGLATDNTSNTNDIGFYGQYNVGQGNVFTGLAYTATDGMYRLFSNVTPEPSTTVNQASIRYSNIQVGGLNAIGNILSTGLSVFGNTRIGSLATPGALHTIIGNVDVSGAGTEYFNIGGNILAVQGSFGSINSTGNLIVGGNLTIGTVGAVSGAFHTVVGNITQTSSGANVYFNTTGNILANVATFGSGNVGGFAIGYRDVPQITAANVTLIASDAGKHYYGSNTNPVTLTIPLNSSVAFGNGTAISLVNQGTGNITITPTVGVLLYLAGNTVTGSKTLTSYGMATLLKVQVNTWFINGTGLV